MATHETQVRPDHYPLTPFDLKICQEALGAAKLTALRCRELSEKAALEACRIVLYSVALDCEAGAGALEEYIRLSRPATDTVQATDVKAVQPVVQEEEATWSPLTEEEPPRSF